MVGQWRGRAELKANTESIFFGCWGTSQCLPLRLTSNEITSSKLLLVTVPSVATWEVSALQKFVELLN